jgi:hypothetical protein
MKPRTTSSEENKLEKELKTLVSRMKNENTALNKILTQLKDKEDAQFDAKMKINKPTKK